MGIQGLTKLLGDNAAGCMKEQKFENYFGRKIAVDASMHIYSFLVVVGRQGDQLLTSEAGEVTSHLQGMFFRTARMLEAGMKPVFVFEGKPPDLKREELAKRSSRREEANTELEAAKEAGKEEDVEKYSKRALNKEGLVYGIATEDMDSLTFGTPRLVRHLMAPASQKLAVTEFDRAQVLELLGLTDDQFIDLCILCGCDYTSKIGGIGPVLEELDSSKFQIPDPFPYQEARRLFKEPDVLKGSDIPALRWTAPDTEGLVQFLVHEKTFAEDRVRKAVDRILAARGKANQGRLESFFGPAVVKSSTIGKRKASATQLQPPSGRQEPEPAKGGKGAKGAAAKGPKGKLGSMGGAAKKKK
eukprot:scaffold2.g6878.t1